MECFIVEKENIDLDQRELFLIGDEAHHAIRSLRIKIGEQLLATDLSGTSYLCILKDSPSFSRRGQGVIDSAVCSIEEVLPNFGEPIRNVLLIQGLISQPSRWEFLLEKATELGASVIQPVTTERTERSSINHERSERILRAAVKQTKRSRKPELRELSPFDAAISRAIHEGRKLFLLHESLNLSETLGSVVKKIGDDNIAIAVGPEGGFSESEVMLASKSGAEVVSLGPRRLRAETAAIAALAIVNDAITEG